MALQLTGLIPRQRLDRMNGVMCRLRAAVPSAPSGRRRRQASETRGNRLCMGSFLGTAAGAARPCRPTAPTRLEKSPPRRT